MNKIIILYLATFAVTTANAQDCFPWCDKAQFKSARCEILCDFDFWQDPSLEVVQTTLESGVNIHANDGRGWQAIHYAAMFGNTNMVEALLAAGANPNGQDGEYDVVSPLLIATYPSHNKLANSLISSNPNAYANLEMHPFRHIHRPASPSEPDLSEEENDLVQGTGIVEALILAGADLNAAGAQDRTALHKSIRYGNIEIARLLIDAGADVDVFDDHGWTPLHVTINRGNGNELATLLLDAGADINARNNNQDTALHTALNYEHEEITRLLINRGADLSAENRFGDTPLFGLVRSFDGRTPDSSLVAKRNAEVLELAKLMIEAGAPVNAVTKRNVSPLTMVRNKGGGKSELEALLLQHGAQDIPPSGVPYCRLRTRRGTEVIEVQIPCE